MFSNLEQAFIIALLAAIAYSLFRIQFDGTYSQRHMMKMQRDLSRIADAAEAAAKSLHKMQCSFSDLNQNVGEGFASLGDQDGR